MEEKNYRNMCIVLIFSVCSVLVLSGLIITNYFMNGRLLAKVDCACTKCDVQYKDTDNTPVIEDKDDNTNIFFPNYSELKCIEQNEKYCLIKNESGLKVESEIDSDHNYVLIINGNRFLPDVEYHVAITDLQFLNDGYIYVEYDAQGLGPKQKAYFLDSNGNVISKTTDINYILNDGNSDRDSASIKFENNKLFLENTVFADGGLGVICSNKQYNSGWWPQYDQTVYVEFNYEYIGNGRISELNHSYKTFSEMLNEQYGVTTCEELKNR